MGFNIFDTLLGSGDPAGYAGPQNASSFGAHADKFLSDPNVLQAMGTMGAGIGGEGSFADIVGNAAVDLSQNQAYQKQAKQQFQSQQDMLKALIELAQSEEGSKLVGPMEDKTTPDSISIDGGKDKSPGKINISYSNPPPQDVDLLGDKPTELFV